MYRRSLAQTWWGPKLCKNMPTTWWNLDKNAQNVSKPMSFTVQSMIFFISWQSWLQSSHSFQFWKNATRAMMSGNQPGDNLEDSDPEFAMFRLDIPQIIRNILKTGQLHCSMVSKTMDPSWTSNSCEMQVAWSCNKLHLECNSHNAIHNKNAEGNLLQLAPAATHMYFRASRAFSSGFRDYRMPKSCERLFQAKRMEESQGKPIRICPKLYRSHRQRLWLCFA